MKHYIIALGLLAAISMAPAALADHKPGHQCPPGHAMKKEWKEDFDEFLSSIGVTADQKKQLDTIKDDAKAQARPLKDNLSAQRRDLMRYIGRADATETEAMAREDAIDALNGQLADIHIRSAFRMKQVLTPAQQQKVAEYMDKKANEFEKKRADWDKRM